MFRNVKKNLNAFSNLINVIPFLSYSIRNDESSIVIYREQLLFSITCLKYHVIYKYNLLTSISGVDFIKLKYRFGITYELLSLLFNTKLRIKIFINEIINVDSIFKIFNNSNWWEREIWDFYGIYFKNHPDLRRILTDYGFEGFPMRKDYPLSGYTELKYDFNKKRIVVESVELAQEFRLLNFETPW